MHKFVNWTILVEERVMHTFSSALGCRQWLQATVQPLESSSLSEVVNRGKLHVRWYVPLIPPVLETIPEFLSSGINFKKGCKKCSFLGRQMSQGFASHEPSWLIPPQPSQQWNSSSRPACSASLSTSTVTSPTSSPSPFEHRQSNILSQPPINYRSHRSSTRQSSVCESSICYFRSST